MTQKTYLAILKGGIYLAFFILFFVFTNLLFPYITSKQLAFNILIEVLAVFWVAFLVKYPEFRPFGKDARGGPKKSYITWGLAAFFAAVLVTCFTGVDFNLSFWGDIERMLGFFHLIHFYLYYLIIITVMRSRNDWLAFFNVSLAVAMAIGLYSFKIAYSTIGNTAYVAGYLIFNIYFALILFFNTKNRGIRPLYIISIILMLVAFWRLRNSGSIVGLGVSVISLFFLYGVLGKSRKVKMATLALAVTGVLAVALVFTNKDSGFVRDNSFLRTLTTLVSSQKGTFQTRLISWRAAYKDFPNHPILGTGYGNYAITFDKYFDPGFYTISRGETYFDHAHNNIIDITTTMGLFGLAAYLSFFLAAAYYLAAGYRRDKINLNDFILVSCLIIAYFIENLAIFDSFVTYLSLMMTLGYVYWLDNQGRAEAAKERYGGNRESYVLLGAGLVMLAVIYQYNIKPWKMLIGTIEGQRVMVRTGDMAQTMEAYKEALRYDTPLDRDSRSTFIRVVNQGQSALNSIEDRQKGQEVLDYAISLAEKNLSLNPKDSLQLMEYAQTLSLAASYNAGDRDKASYYIKQAEDAVNRSIEASPGRIPVYFTKAQIYLVENRKDEVIETLKYAVSLNDGLPDGHCQLAKSQLFYKLEKEGYEEMDKCLDRGGVDNISPLNMVKALINHYGEAEDRNRVLILYERYTYLEPNDVSGWINIARLYAEAGAKDKAIASARQAAQLDAGIKEGAEEFIRNLDK